jgi:Flp pilus assembly protein TadG
MDTSLFTRSCAYARLRNYAAGISRAYRHAHAVNQPTRRQRLRAKQARGQALILVAVSLVVLLGFVGLATDGGQVYVYMGHLRRATDAASLASAAQYREGRTFAEMEAAAKEVMALNGIDPTALNIKVEVCDDAHLTDAALCTTPRRKLVRVNGTLDVPMSFLSILGIHDIKVSANSIGEAASLDVVMVIDISESMAFDAAVGDPYRDPNYCNNSDPTGSDGFVGDCHPFQEVKQAAINFAHRILNKASAQEEDRLAIVTFANGWSADKGQGTYVRTAGWTTEVSDAESIIQGLKVYEPETCFTPRNGDAYATPPTGTINNFFGPCRLYNASNDYQYLDCLSCRAVDWGSPQPANDDWSALSTTNIGGGMRLAGNMFSLNTRKEALWVVVLLTDGMANATDPAAGDNIANYNTYPLGYCPPGEDPLCQDKNVNTRHGNGNTSYDADDYARDMADFVGCYPKNPASLCAAPGQGAVIFTIGLGNVVIDSKDDYGRPYGATLLRYIARVGYAGDPNPSNDPCKGVTSYSSWCGNYYFSPQGPQLTRIFENIASRIFTRIVH